MCSNNIIILDWDDTLYPTSHSVYKNVFVDDYARLDMVLCEFLNKCVSLGKCYIVSNASHNWIINTSQNIPLSSNIIHKHINVVSAKDAYMRNGTTIDKWKQLSFEKIHTEHNDCTNILSIGDAEYEYNALIYLNNICGDKLLKSIKLSKNPEIDVIIEQIQSLLYLMDYVVEYKGHIDWKFIKN